MIQSIIYTLKHYRYSYSDRFEFPDNEYGIISAWHEYSEDYGSDNAIIEIHGKGHIHLLDCSKDEKKFILQVLKDFLLNIYNEPED